MKVLETADELKNWEDYRILIRERVKQLSGEPEAAYISKARVEFDINGKVWRGHAVLFGKKSRQMAMKMRKEGILFLEGTVTADGKRLTLQGFSGKLLEGAEKTFTRLKLGLQMITAAGGDGAEEGEEEVQLKLKKAAQRIEKAVAFWDKTEQVVTRQLRQLQRAIQATGDPRNKSVIRGLEEIRTKLEKIDDEARDCSEAAERGDQRGFVIARKDFVQKANRILGRVRNDELIKMADANPIVSIQLRSTLESSLVRLMKAV